MFSNYLRARVEGGCDEQLNKIFLHTYSAQHIFAPVRLNKDLYYSINHCYNSKCITRQQLIV